MFSVLFNILKVSSTESDGIVKTTVGAIPRVGEMVSYYASTLRDRDFARRLVDAFIQKGNIEVIPSTVFQPGNSWTLNFEVMHVQYFYRHGSLRNTNDLDETIVINLIPHSLGK